MDTLRVPQTTLQILDGSVATTGAGYDMRQGHVDGVEVCLVFSDSREKSQGDRDFQRELV